ncbi:MAG: hypothetical protein KGN84_04120, partial [Acidobacteriota bacterium]|nr:hypothetical protein [Acidobacteriota bacterium]
MNPLRGETGAPMPNSQPGCQRPHRKKGWAAAALAVIAGLLLYFGAHGKGFDWPVFVRTVVGLDWGWLG